MSEPVFTARVEGKFPDLQTFERTALMVAEDELENAGRYLLGELQKATPVGVSANMRRAWFMRREGRMIVISNPTEYLLATELGRRASPISREGRVSLRLWVRRILGIPESEADAVTFLIARKKAKEATPGKFFVRDTIQRVFPRIVAYLLGPRILARLNDGYSGGGGNIQGGDSL